MSPDSFVHRTFPYSPIRRPTILPSHVKIFLESTLKESSFENVVPPSRHVYKESWYEQENDAPTCVPWSFANAFHVLGLSTKPEVIKYIDSLHNHAIASNGFPFHYAVMKAADYQLGVNFVQLSLHNKRELYFSEDMQTIVKELDEGSVMAVAVDQKKFLGVGSGAHAIDIVGYRQGKHLYLQVLDPNYGIFWVSAEHVFQSLVSPRVENVYAVRRKKENTEKIIA